MPNRRMVLKAGAVGALGSAVAACAPGPAPGGEPAPGALFHLGVASGYHSPSTAVLWTRVDPRVLPGGVGSVIYEVFDSPALTNRVALGTQPVEADRDYCIKVLAEGLQPGRNYWYRFTAGGETSPVGRTATVPAAGSPVERLRFVWGSCQNWQSGYYPAWRTVAEMGTALSGVIHVGDYMYESGKFSFGDVRSDWVGEAEDLAGYRAKYRMHKSDADLQAAHAAHPWVLIWDDHEFRNDYDRLLLASDGARGRDAYRAWFEYQPVWPIEGTRIHRSLRFGDLAELTLLDTRQYRDATAGKILNDGTPPPAGIEYAAGRTILGADQRAWLLDTLTSAQADGVPWKLIGNQVMVSPIRLVDLDEPILRQLNPDIPKHNGVYLNLDGWDGYQWERDVILATLADRGIRNTAFLTGDIHSFWQAPLRADYDDERSPVVVQEFVGGSISSIGPAIAGYELAGAAEQLVAGLSPGFRYTDFRNRGYGLIEVTPTKATVDFRAVDAAVPRAPAFRTARFTWPVNTSNVALDTSTVRV